MYSCSAGHLGSARVRFSSPTCTDHGSGSERNTWAQSSHMTAIDVKRFQPAVVRREFGGRQGGYPPPVGRRLAANPPALERHSAAKPLSFGEQEGAAA